MTPRLPNAAVAALLFCLVGPLGACSRGVAHTNAVAPAAGETAVATVAKPPSPAVSADANKTGQAYVEELEHDPALFEKQREICHGHGADSQPSPELEGPCAAWDMARSNLELDQQLHKGGVKNTDSL